MATVRIGSSVRLRLGQDGKLEESWKIVDASEADPKAGLISASTPLAQAVLGRQAGELVQVHAPQSQYTVTILDVG